MNKASKYMSLFIVIAFTAGQVQYSCTSYFCTMLNTFVPSGYSALAIHSAKQDGACTECDASYVTAAGSQVLAPNCFIASTIQKDVTGTFVGTSTAEMQAAASFVLIVPHPMIRRASVLNRFVVRTASSPPLDLPTLNSSLLI